MVGLGFANSPAAMPAAGGRHPIFGTNPVAAIFPRRSDPASPARRAADDRPEPERSGARQVDGRGEGGQADSARLGARRERRADDRPEGRHGRHRCCRSARSQPKGAMLALVVELLVTALIGAHFGFEASSFFVDEGNRPKIGQASSSSTPTRSPDAPRFSSVSRCWSRRCSATPACACPGARREALLRDAERDGIEVADALLAALDA